MADQEQGTLPADTEVDERIERTDVGCSITVELKRGTGTRDQDKINAKTKGATVEEARDDMDELKPWLKQLASDVRSWQPSEDR